MTRKPDTLAQALLKRANTAEAAARRIVHYERLANAARAEGDIITAKACEAAVRHYRTEAARAV
jgi:hypothetical protein